MKTLINICCILIGIIGGWFLNNYFPGYLKKKGENLATKEDIKKITEITEDVQKEFREQFELFSSDVQFKYDFYYKQYSELYCHLYSIVIQSEYLRYFLSLCGNEFEFNKYPFLELYSEKTHMNTEVDPSGEIKCTLAREKVDTPITNFNKKQLCDYIISIA